MGAVNLDAWETSDKHQRCSSRATRIARWVLDDLILTLWLTRRPGQLGQWMGAGQSDRVAVVMSKLTQAP